ncbi:MAG TPA: arylsulfotransferase family protein [Conexibacter sp.]|nr:arylsulfotransferase family protein [Conexibacter sp.]
MSRRSGTSTLEQVRPRLWIAGAAALLLAAGGLALWLLLRDGAESEEPQPTAADVLRFHSRPRLDPDRVRVAVPARRGTAPGYVFLAVKRGPGQDGPQIVDDEGRVVWFRPAPPRMAVTGFRVQRYRGEPVLTWWQGRTRLGHGMGEYVVLDRHYREIAVVRAGHGYMGDHHELQLTPRGTAYLSIYAPRSADLSSVGGPREGTIFESIVQEVDVGSGRVVWEWHSADHLPVSEGVTPPKEGKPHDYFHVNSVDEDARGRVLLSARNMHAIYAVSKRTGRVLWRLGGERSDFAMGPGARFAFQHDATWLPDRGAPRFETISLFDNQATPPRADQSRGLVLRLDLRARTARVVRQYRHPDKLLAGAEGNLQTLPNGNVFASWGPEEHVSEFGRGGRLLLDLVVPPGADSYQAFRFPWRGEPLDRPAIAARRRAGSGRVTAWASWNGATELRSWRLLAGEDPDALVPLGDPVPRGDFETTLRARSDAPYVAVAALDADGRQVGQSRPVEPAER